MVTTSEELLARAFPEATKRYEYRVERTQFGDQPTKHLSDLLERLNELGKEGSRVVVRQAESPGARIAAADGDAGRHRHAD